MKNRRFPDTPHRVTEQSSGENADSNDDSQATERSNQNSVVDDNNIENALNGKKRKNIVHFKLKQIPEYDENTPEAKKSKKNNVECLASECFDREFGNEYDLIKHLKSNHGAVEGEELDDVGKDKDKNWNHGDTNEASWKISINPQESDSFFSILNCKNWKTFFVFHVMSEYSGCTISSRVCLRILGPTAEGLRFHYKLTFGNKQDPNLFSLEGDRVQSCRVPQSEASSFYSWQTCVVGNVSDLWEFHPLKDMTIIITVRKMFEPSDAYFSLKSLG